MRKYEKTHSWISFELNLDRISPATWILLGEAQSKCDQIAGVPLRPSTARDLHKLYLAKGALGTTAIEGNTLSEQEVLQQVEGKLDLPPSKEYLKQETKNIIEAFNLIAKNLREYSNVELSVKDISLFNNLVLSNLSLNNEVVRGKIRTHSVGVEGARYRGAPPEDCEYLLDRLCEWLNNKLQSQNNNHAIAFALLKAIIAHLYIAWIHPYGDGNGRTARLVEYKILLSSGIPTPAAHLLSDFYNETRHEYYRQLARTSQSNGDIIPFIEYAVAGFVEGLGLQLKTILEQQWDITWRSYIHEMFADKNKSSDSRKKHLALDISQQDKPVPISKLTEISPRVAASYAIMKNKNAINVAIYRDVKELVNMELIIETSEGVAPNKNILLSFLPFRKSAIVQSELPL